MDWHHDRRKKKIVWENCPPSCETWADVELKQSMTKLFYSPLSTWAPGGSLWCVCCVPVCLLSSACTPHSPGGDERREGRIEETLSRATPPRFVPACSVTSALWHVAVLNRRAIIWCQVVQRPQTSVMALPCSTVSVSLGSMQPSADTLPCFHGFIYSLPQLSAASSWDKITCIERTSLIHPVKSGQRTSARYWNFTSVAGGVKFQVWYLKHPSCQALISIVFNSVLALHH